MVNFEAFLQSMKLSANLLFMKSVLLKCQRVNFCGRNGTAETVPHPFPKTSQHLNKIPRVTLVFLRLCNCANPPFPWFPPRRTHFRHGNLLFDFDTLKELGRYTSQKAYCNDQEKLQNIKNETKGEQNFYLLGSLQKAISKLLEIIEI